MAKLIPFAALHAATRDHREIRAQTARGSPINHVAHVHAAHESVR
jgi:hypothetical protein